MTIAKASALAGGMLLTMAVGVWTGQAIVGRHAQSSSRTDRESATERAPVERSAAATPAAGAAATPSRAVLTPAPTHVLVADVSTAALRERIRPLFSTGTNLDIAAEGFRDAEQFAAVAHAARNTALPFVVLKHQVIDEGESLSRAIGTLRPEINAPAEAERATAQARSDLASLPF